MRSYRKIAQLAYAAMVVATIWLFTPAMADSGNPEIAKLAWPLIENGALVLDVRTQEEFDEGHLQGSVHVHWENTDAIIEAIGSDLQRQVVLYCRSGRRAALVKSALDSAGYDHVFNATGFDALQSTHP